MQDSLKFSDCGIFALANATALVHEENPSTFLYNQKEMRDHLFHCLEPGKLHLFLTEEIGKSNLLTQLKFVVILDNHKFLDV